MKKSESRNIRQPITGPAKEKKSVSLVLSRTCDNTHAGMRTYRHGQVAREKPVLQNAPVGDVDALALIRHDDNRPT
jgi:hypothetical protein